MKFFAVVYHSPDTVAKWLCDNLGLTPNDFNFATNSINRKRVQVFLEYKDFARTYKTLPKKPSEQIVLVFGQPFQFYSWNIMPLDYQESDEPHLNAFEYIQLDRKRLSAKQEPIHYENRNYLTKIVETVSAFDSLLHGLMSFIYTMKTPEQKIAKESSCRYLYRGHGLETLRRELSPLNERQIERMINMLNSEVAQRIQKAFADKTTIEERSKTHNVSAYELRYIESIALKTA